MFLRLFQPNLKERCGHRDRYRPWSLSAKRGKKMRLEQAKNSRKSRRKFKLRKSQDDFIAPKSMMALQRQK